MGLLSCVRVGRLGGTVAGGWDIFFVVRYGLKLIRVQGGVLGSEG